MFDRRLAVTGGSLLLVMLLSAGAAALFHQNPATPIQEHVSGVEIAAEEEAGEEYLYMLREYQGRIGVFAPGEEEPEMTLDVQVKYLPEYDQAQMEVGGARGQL